MVCCVDPRQVAENTRMSESAAFQAEAGYLQVIKTIEKRNSYHNDFTKMSLILYKADFISIPPKSVNQSAIVIKNDESNFSTWIYFEWN